MADVYDLPRRRIRAGINTNHQQEILEGLQNRDQFARAQDYFTNVPARMGFGTPSLAESATYELERLSFSYWLLITLYENHWITGKIVDTPAEDMVKAWPRLTSDIDPKELTMIDQVVRRTQTKIKMLEGLKWGRLFGGAGALMVIDGQEDQLDEPVDLEAVGIGDYKGLLPFDRWTGIYPEGAVCTDINRPIDFNRPEAYRVSVSQGGQSFQVHSSRILRFCGPEMPSPEREAHSWWGISEVVRPYEEIKKRDNMSWNILSLTFRAQILGIKYPELEKMLSGIGMGQQGASQWNSRMSEINRLLSNQSMIALPEKGELQSVNYTFSGLSDCYQQFQLDISGATGIPVTRLFGRTISGLGQSNDADERIYEERIATDQDNRLRPQLEKLYPVLCMSALGYVPDDLDLAFPSIRVLDEKEKSELAKTVTDTVMVALNGAIISPQTAAKELKQSSDMTGIFTNITDEAIEKLSDDVQQTGEMDGDSGMDKLFSGEHEENKAEESIARAADDEFDEDEEEFAYDGDCDVCHRPSEDLLHGVCRSCRGRRRAKDADDFKEGEHPRDEEGQFKSKGGGATAGLKEYASREDWPEHIQSMKIPPAWTDVRVSDDPQAALQATGRDSKGRPQYVYSQKFKESQAALKFDRVSSLSKDMPMIDGQLVKLQKSKDPRTKDHADCMTLIRRMGIRPGSDSDTKAKVKAYGASTLQGHHVWELGNVTRLRFVGKKGVTLSLPVEDKGLANMLRERKAKAGGSGKLFPSVSDSSLLDFSHDDLDHGGYKTKDFRTNVAAETAQSLVQGMKPPKNEKEYKKKVKEVAKKVAEKLGNTATVALQSYIPPQIFAAWREGYATS